ncbi:MAG: ABC transporter substrate-binding protein [Chloroflexota bacterium]|nr:ABC transporter substrate-binding protein [Chloroflexota bacterium]MDE2949957.1 ABC transporter substrate-binding protein [Chloroflexota bacterium]
MMLNGSIKIRAIALLCAFLLLIGGAAAQDVITLQFYYPVGVAGPLAQAIDGYVAEFNALSEDIQVEPIFTGNYVENMARAQAGILSGQPPDVAILLSTDLYTLVDMEGVIPLDDYIASEDGLDIDDFFDAFMSNSTSAGQVWGIPWQRSTPILYYNKDAFAEVGLDPESPPATWEELVEFGKQLVVSDGDNVTRWGVEIPTSFWIYANFAIQAGQHIGSVEDDPCGVYLDTPEAIEALSFLRSLQVEHGIMPDGVNQWGVAPADFIAGATAMIYHSTGSLSSLLNDVPFELGTGFMPGGPAGYGANVGGGNFYIMADIGQERQDAAWKFINWMVRPEQIGQWGIDSGYVAPRNAAWETDPLMSYAADVPQASTARMQLEYAVKEFPATLAGPEMAVITTQAVEAVYTGQSTPEEALRVAQERSDELLVQAGCDLGG